MGAIDLRDVATVVVDEADQMADMGFLPAVRRIVGQTRDDRQVLLFSATLDGPVAKLIKDFQHDPAFHEVGPKGPDIHAAHHVFWQMDRTDRNEHAAGVIDRTGSTIVFTRTRHGADRLAKQLGKLGVSAQPIHGGRSQNQRDRALDAFKRGTADALIATDVAARGIHVHGVSTVIHYDPPADGSTYHHRSGRTARAGATGVVVSFVEPGTTKDVKKLQREVGIQVDVRDPDLDELEVAVLVSAVEAPAAADAAASSRSGSRRVAKRRGRSTKQRRAESTAAGSIRSRARHGQVLQCEPRLRLHRPGLGRRRAVRPLLEHRDRWFQDPRREGPGLLRGRCRQEGPRGPLGPRPLRPLVSRGRGGPSEREPRP